MGTGKVDCFMVWLGIVLLNLLVGLASYMFWFHNADPIRMEEVQVMYFPSNSMMHVRREYCLAEPMVFTLSREIVSVAVDQPSVQLADVTMIDEAGCHKKPFIVTLPPLVGGSYIYRSAIKYYSNPLRFRIKRLPDINFTVLREPNA